MILHKQKCIITLKKIKGSYNLNYLELYNIYKKHSIYNKQ